MRAKPEMPDLKSLKLFDCCFTLGRTVLAGSPECVPDAKAAIALMDRYHIAEALVHDHHARSIHPRDHGNQRILEAVKDEPRLHPVWVLEPPRLPGRGPAESLVKRMLDAGVHAARLRMRPLGPFAWLWQDLCAVLEEHRVPCFLDFGSPGMTTGELQDIDVNGIRQIALNHPALPLVLSHVFGGLGVHPAVLPLMRRVPNLYLDITAILEYWREAVANLGPERVLFATGTPFADPGILVSNVQYGIQMDPEAKKKICGDNLRNLLGQVKTTNC